MSRFVVRFETEDVQSLVKAIKLLQGNGFDPSVHEFAAGTNPPQGPVVRTPVVVARQPVNVSLDRDGAWNRLLSLLKDNPKKVLRLLKDSQNGLSAEIVAEQFGEPANWFTGVLNGGIQRNVRAAGFQLEDVIHIDRSKTPIMYYPGPELKRREVP